MPHDAFPCRSHRGDVSRRNVLWELGGGLGGVALTALLADEAAAAARTANPLAARRPMFAAKAKAVINIFCPGGLSHLDTFDHKPELVKRAGTPFDTTGAVQFFASKPGNCQPSYWPFRRHGESGRWVSDLQPGLAGHVDAMAFIHSMQSKTALHGIKGGTSYGTSDELGFKAEEHPTYCYDLHATALHLLGIDHERLSNYNNGIRRRLTDVHGHVIDSILT